MALTDDEKAQLEALQQKANAPDDDDYEIEIWDETGAGAKVPYRTGKNWLQRFGIGLPEEPEDQAPEDQPQPGKGTRGGSKAAANRANVAQGYFGKKSS